MPLVLDPFLRVWPFDAAQSVVLARTLKNGSKKGSKMARFACQRALDGTSDQKCVTRSKSGSKSVDFWVQKMVKNDTFSTPFLGPISPGFTMKWVPGGTIKGSKKEGQKITLFDTFLRTQKPVFGLKLGIFGPEMGQKMTKK